MNADEETGGLTLPVDMKASSEIPEVVGRFRIVDKLGEGGMGVVYRAHDPSLNRDVALKLVHSSHGGAEARDRLLREAQAMARLSHPNLVPVYEVGAHDGLVFIAMELVHGDTLGRWLSREQHGHVEILDKFIQAARGLGAAHRAGILHRDFKPTNVIVEEGGRTRVLDFGLARYVSDAIPVQRALVASDKPLASRITQLGELVGTPAYMSPEHFTGDVTPASDQWSLCVALYRALFRQLPFDAESTHRLLELIATEGPRVPPTSDVPEPVVAAVMRGLRSAPEERWSTVDALADALVVETRLDRSLDPLAFQRQRRIAANVLGASGLVIYSIVGVRTQFRFALNLEQVLLVQLAALFGLAPIAVMLRAALRASAHSRRLMAVFALALVVPCVHSALALGRHEDLALGLRVDAAFTAAFYFLGAIVVDRWFVFPAAIIAVYVPLSGLVPALVFPGYGLSIVATSWLAVWFWRDVPQRSSVS